MAMQTFVDSRVRSTSEMQEFNRVDRWSLLRKAAFALRFFWLMRR
jgi:hypothetical protein